MSTPLNDGLAKLTIVAQVVAREFHAPKQNPENSDNAAKLDFGQRSMALGLADLIELTLTFDGMTTTLEIDTMVLPVEKGARDEQ